MNNEDELNTALGLKRIVTNISEREYEQLLSIQEKEDTVIPHIIRKALRLYFHIHEIRDAVDQSIDVIEDADTSSDECHCGDVLYHANDTHIPEDSGELRATETHQKLCLLWDALFKLNDDDQNEYSKEHQNVNRKI